VAKDNLVGSLDVPPPTGQTFAHIKNWTDLWKEYEHLVNDAGDISSEWWEAAKFFRGYVDTLDAVVRDFRKIVVGLSVRMTGAAADALFARGEQIVNHIRDVADTARKYPAAIQAVGNEIVAHNVAFVEAFHTFHKLEAAEKRRVEADIRALAQQAGLDEAQTTELVERAKRIAVQIIEENYMIPHQRRLLMILAARYTAKDSALAPIEIQVKRLDPVIDNNNSGNNNGGNNYSGYDDSGYNNSGYNNRTGPGVDVPGLDGLGGSGGGLSGGGSGGDVPGLDGLGGSGGGSSGSGPGVSVPSPDGLGAGADGDGVGGSGSSGGGVSPERREALEDAKEAAVDAIEALKRPTDSPERAQALEDAQKAVEDAIDSLLGGSGVPLPSSLGAGSGLGSGAGRPATSSSDPDAQTRKKALRDAQEAIDDALQELLDENEASDADPHEKQVRADALRDAQEAAEQAIRDLIEAVDGDETDGEVRADALKDVQEAIDGALDEYEESLSDSGIDAHEREVRQDALEDARAVVDEVLDELADEQSDAGLDTPEEIRGDAHSDARRALIDGFDRLISETLDDDTLSDADKLTRVDTLNDAKKAVLGAVDELVEAEAERAQTRSELSSFLTASSGGSSQTTGSSDGSSQTTGSDRAEAAASTGPGVRLGTTVTTNSVSQSNPGPAAPMHLDAASLPANQSMPMAPPLGGMGAAGPPHRERERTDRLAGEADAWTDDDDLSSRAIGRRPTNRTGGTP
jgi:hypothetical protein